MCVDIHANTNIWNHLDKNESSLGCNVSFGICVIGISYNSAHEQLKSEMFLTLIALNICDNTVI